ncbi:phospholipase A2 inhibitor gamma subunit B-like isoform X2 [Hyperolius riggenbachi]|uniref:phospholipase A2 inhibitor gamma subunit B-like isoform X2 n=1 Tax=Hyperolius riggenbachi TaxID=752182 RepID=UPI0035A29762
MSSFVGFFGVLLALATSGYALTCRKCSATTSTCSKPSSETCASASGYKCGVVYSTSTTDGANTEKYAWACLPETECNKTGTANSEKVKIKMATSCCNGDDCKLDIPSLPADSSGTSDYKCPSCNPDSSTSCTSSDTIQCAEGESMCLATSADATELISVPTVFRGCATDNFCAIGKSLYTDQPTDFSCTEGTKDAKATSGESEKEKETSVTTEKPTTEKEKATSVTTEKQTTEKDKDTNETNKKPTTDKEKDTGAKPEPQKSKSGSTTLYNGFYLQAAICFLILKSLL